MEGPERSAESRSAGAPRGSDLRRVRPPQCEGPVAMPRIIYEILDENLHIFVFLAIFFCLFFLGGE